MEMGSRVSEAHALDPLTTAHARAARDGRGVGLSQTGDLLAGSQGDLSAVRYLMLGEDSLLFPT